MFGLLATLVKADLTWVGWLGVTMMLTWSGLFVLAWERARRQTLVAAVRAAEAGTVVFDRRRGRTLMVLKPADRRAAVMVVRRRGGPQP
jgi:hypothetical protein